MTVDYGMYLTAYSILSVDLSTPIILLSGSIITKNMSTLLEQEMISFWAESADSNMGPSPSTFSNESQLFKLQNLIKKQDYSSKLGHISNHDGFMFYVFLMENGLYKYNKTRCWHAQVVGQ